MSTYDSLPPVGRPVEIFTHLHVREDILQLFGFASLQERRLFRLLITVSGVGCRLALNVLSSMSVDGFCRAIVAEDIKALTRVSGLGKRSAERLVVELRERVTDIQPEAVLRGGTPVVTQEAQDAIAALETLGFKGDIARKTIQKLTAELSAPEQTAENLIRTALQQLNS